MSTTAAILCIISTGLYNQDFGRIKILVCLKSWNTNIILCHLNLWIAVESDTASSEKLINISEPIGVKRSVYYFFV